MRILVCASLLCLAATTQVFAADVPPSEASIRQLLAATDSQKMLDNILKTVDASIDSGMKSALNGQPVNAKAQKIIDDMRVQITALVRESLAWKDMEPLITEVYKRSLTQQEVNGMIAFYESAAGKAVVRKMPLILQNTMALMEERMKTIAPKMVQIQKDAIARAKAAEAE
jgi:hypothetical protein